MKRLLALLLALMMLFSAATVFAGCEDSSKKRKSSSSSSDDDDDDDDDDDSDDGEDEGKDDDDDAENGDKDGDEDSDKENKDDPDEDDQQNTDNKDRPTATLPPYDFDEDDDYDSKEPGYDDEEEEDSEEIVLEPELAFCSSPKEAFDAYLKAYYELNPSYLDCTLTDEAEEYRLSYQDYSLSDIKNAMRVRDNRDAYNDYMYYSKYFGYEIETTLDLFDSFDVDTDVQSDCIAFLKDRYGMKPSKITQIVEIEATYTLTGTVGSITFSSDVGEHYAICYDGEWYIITYWSYTDEENGEFYEYYDFDTGYLLYRFCLLLDGEL